MKFFKGCIIFLFLLIISMGVACAEDVNQTSQDTLDMVDTEIISDIPEGTFDDLDNNITLSPESIRLDRDYKYNENDNVKNIKFNNKNYEIDGNNHAIDGNGKTLAFRVENNSNITIKNLIIRNCNDSSIIMLNSHLVTINVTFENNNGLDVGAAVYCENSTYLSTNDTFTENYAPQLGSSIFARDSQLNLTNITFTNKNSINWSLIYGANSIIGIFDSLFRNITSRYATVISNNYKTLIKNSKFIDLFANMTAGAVSVKGSKFIEECYLTIEDCEFTNVSANRNGGAIFADIYGDSDGNVNGIVLISNTTFKQSSGDFGGALIQLGGTCNIVNSTFINNSAKENGGAIYASNADVSIYNTEFTNNKADENNGLGGALFLDYGSASIVQNTFENNAAKEGGAIYSYQTGYQISYCQFENNGEDIHTYFDDDGSAITNCGKCSATVNDCTYIIPIRYNGEKIILNPQKINGSANDSYFNLRDQGLVTSVKNQGQMGSCWAFGAAGALESAFLIATGETIDISENNIQNLGLCYSIYGERTLTESGTFFKSASYFVSWLGAINESDDPYDELGKISSLKYGPNAYRVLNAIFIDISDRNAIKEALTKYGALNLFIYGADQDTPYYNNVTYALYNDNHTGNHYVTLVGWDDTFSKSNFNITPPDDGAWICKNSWGTEWGDGGYFYLSYYDRSLDITAYNGTDLRVVGFSFEDVEYYDKLYQNELYGIDYFNENYDTYGNEFASDDGDLIVAVGTYFEKANVPFTVAIFINNTLTYTQSGKSHHAGYYTIKLDKYIAVDAYSEFDIRIKSYSLPLANESLRAPIVLGVNYVIVDGQGIDLGRQNLIAPVKAYTYRNPGITKNIFKCIDNKETIFTVTNVEESSLIVTFNGKNSTIKITNGTGSLSLGVLPVGDYTVTVYYKNQTIINLVSIKNTIDTNGITSVTIGYNTELSFSAQFLDLYGNPLNNKKLTIIFDGEKVTGYTTEDGYFTVTVEKGTKIGSHTLVLTNPTTGQKVNVAIKIVSRFSGNKNIKMHYFDGSSYKVRIVGNNGKFVGKGQTVNIKIGKKTFKVKTNAKGYAILKIPKTITPGKYTIAATYMGQTVKNSLTVKQVLKTSKTVKVKKSAKKLVLKATLKKGKTPLKKKLIKFKVNGKTYKAKTNKKGLAKATIKKKAIKKFKKKKYTIKVSYLNDVVKSTLKVKR